MHVVRGGIQPVIVHVSPPSIEEDESWDVNYSMTLVPLSMCCPFTTDYDGDEMTLSMVTQQDYIQECMSFEWPHEDSSPYKEDLNNSIISFVARIGD
jgi:hypothetical protein